MSILSSVIGIIVGGIIASIVVPAWFERGKEGQRIDAPNIWRYPRHVSLRLDAFKWHYQRRRAWQRHNRDGRVSLKQLGWRVVNLA